MSEIPIHDGKNMKKFNIVVTTPFGGIQVIKPCKVRTESEVITIIADMISLSLTSDRYLFVGLDRFTGETVAITKETLRKSIFTIKEDSQLSVCSPCETGHTKPNPVA